MDRTTQKPRRKNRAQESVAGDTWQPNDGKSLDWRARTEGTGNSEYFLVTSPKVF
jgi:hypothetical protein